MFKIVSFFALVVAAAAAPGHLVETHAVLQPAVVAKTAVVDHSASSAVTHQSYTNLLKKVPVVPVVHSASVLHAAPVVHSPAVVHSAPLLHSAPLVHSAPLLHSAPLVHTYAAAPVVQSVPLVKTVVAAPTTYALHH